MPDIKLGGYIKTLIIGYLAIFGVNAILSLVGVVDFSVWFAAYYPLLIILAYIVLNLLAAMFPRVFPTSIININSKVFRTFKFERKFYEAIGVRSFKDKIPDLGGLFKGFYKSEFSGSDSDYLGKFIKSTIVSEIVHMLGILSCIIIFFVFNEHVINFALPAFLLNTYFNILPIFVQRYNRPKLYRIYERQVALAVKSSEEE